MAQNKVFNDRDSCIFVLLGASGDLARKKIYPALWQLFKQNLLPKETAVIGYGRSALTQSELQAKILSHLKGKGNDDKNVENFLGICSYVRGPYTDSAAFKHLDAEMRRIEAKEKFRRRNRIFYLAIPPDLFQASSANIKATCFTKSGWNRLIVEKPFGRDSDSAAVLSEHLASLFHENEIYRIDHYLGKEMVQNLLLLRFGNSIFEPVWNSKHISAVLISVKEPFGPLGRSYFDECGIIRDIMQNHLMQILCLVAMEPSKSSAADDLRDAKVCVLQCVDPLKLENTVLGQYIGDPKGKAEACLGYLDDPVTAKGSNTPTFATSVAYVKSKRWNGVPFILRCGKALNERKAEIRIQFCDSPWSFFQGQTERNELVIRIQPNEAIYMKIVVKRPGMGVVPVENELDLTYHKKYKDSRIPDAYEHLMYDAFTGDQSSFVRDDELKEAWRIFTPLLHCIERERIQPIKYVFGSLGPKESDELCARHGYRLTDTYQGNKAHL